VRLIEIGCLVMEIGGLVIEMGVSCHRSRVLLIQIHVCLHS